MVGADRSRNLEYKPNEQKRWENALSNVFNKNQWGGRLCGGSPGFFIKEAKSVQIYSGPVGALLCLNNGKNPAWMNKRMFLIKIIFPKLIGYIGNTHQYIGTDTSMQWGFNSRLEA